MNFYNFNNENFQCCSAKYKGYFSILLLLNMKTRTVRFRFTVIHVNFILLPITLWGQTVNWYKNFWHFIFYLYGFKLLMVSLVNKIHSATRKYNQNSELKCLVTMTNNKFLWLNVKFSYLMIENYFLWRMSFTSRWRFANIVAYWDVGERLCYI